MKQSNLSSSLAEADQSVKDFIASLYETFSAQLKQQNEPLIKIEYFGAVMEVKLLSFDGVYGVQEGKRDAG
jgi:D-Tyr-tRNAtyr deacylase